MIDNLINYLLPSIEHFGGWGYWIAFFAALFETTVVVGLFLPGSTIILILGALSASGYLDPADLFWFAVLGAILGDNINYFLGQHYGARWLGQGFWFIKASHIEKAQSFMNAHGAKSVFLGRFIPSIKEIVPFIVGSVQMDKKVFLFWNVLGAIGWGFEWVFAGYFFAKSLSLAQLWLSRAGIVSALILLCILLLSLGKWLLTWKGKQLLEIIISLVQSINEALAKNEHVNHWVQKHPRAIIFLQKRFNNTVFTGLPLTILLLTFTYLLGLFLGIIEDIITSDPIIAADVRIANLIPSFRTETLTTVFSWITLLGKSQVVLVFILTVVTLLWIWQKKNYILPFFITIVGSESFTYLGKLAFHRPRPEMRVYAEHSFSFPSGHATIAVAFYGFVAYLLVRTVKDWSRKINVIFLTLFIILVIGFSRIYLGEHYVSDVWCGYLVGAMWLTMAITLAEWLKHKQYFVGITKHPARARTISSMVLASAIVFYIVFCMQYQMVLAEPPLKKTHVVSKVTEVFTSEQLKYTETLIGSTQEPVNFILVADNDDTLVKVMRDAGWVLADKADISSFSKIVKALITSEPYSSAPVSPSFWNAKIEDISFAKMSGTENWLTNTKHLRLWKTDYITVNGEHIYIGMVNAINGLKWGLMPKISPDLDTQREILCSDLKQTENTENCIKMQLVQPLTGYNFIGDQFFSDGKAYTVFLK